MTFPFGQPITVRRVGRDRHGDRVPGSEASFVVTGCALYPRSVGLRAEQNNRQMTVTAGLTLLCPTGTQVFPTDEVELVDGTVWRVIGEPGGWASPLTGWPAGVQVELERVTG